MGPEYILLICAGGVFLLVLFAYLIVGIRNRNAMLREDKALRNSYAEENLHKMEYDVAFYEGDAFKVFNTGSTVQQVTIDDLLGSGSQDMEEMTQKAIFSQLEDEGVEEIRGTFKPSR